MREPACDIIMPVFNKPELTRQCIASIRAHTRTAYRIILVDNHSDGPTRTLLQAIAADRERITLIRNADNVGWVKAVNQGLGRSSAPYCCIMNNDTVVKTDDWLHTLIAAAEGAPEIGLVNPRFTLKKGAGRIGSLVEVDFCRGYCMLVKRRVIDTIGTLDERYGLGYYDDDDYSVRAIAAGFRCVMVNDVVVEHLGDATFSELFKDGPRRALHEKNKALFFARWGRRLRIVCVITGAGSRDAAGGTILDLARRQHIVYLWNASGRLALRHTSVRERPLLPGLGAVSLAAAVWFNRFKKAPKRYDIIMTDSRPMKNILSILAGNAAYFDFGKDRDAIMAAVNSLAGGSVRR